MGDDLRPAPPSRAMSVLIIGAVAGVAGGAAMVPIGLAIRHGLGLDVNVYGELTARALFGSTAPLGLLLVHAGVSVTLAMPIVWSVTRSRAWGGWWGLAWGVGEWLVANTWLLPLAFDRPSPWTLGIAALWPSLAVHVAYGTVTGVVGASLLSRRQGAPSRR